jgi:hypothetical protein
VTNGSCPAAWRPLAAIWPNPFLIESSLVQVNDANGGRARARVDFVSLYIASDRSASMVSRGVRRR